MVEAEIVPATGNLCLNRRPPLSAGPPARCEASRRRKPNREVNQIAETRESKESKDQNEEHQNEEHQNEEDQNEAEWECGSSGTVFGKAIERHTAQVDQTTLADCSIAKLRDVEGR
jgi:hypothetical protein